METYLTVEETAQTLKVSIDSVRRWLRSGKLRGNRYGGVWRVPASELHRTRRSSGAEQPSEQPEEKNGRLRPSEARTAATIGPGAAIGLGDGPRRDMNAFLRLADELAPTIAVGQKQPVTSAKISKALDETREERDREINAG